MTKDSLDKTIDILGKTLDATKIMALEITRKSGKISCIYIKGQPLSEVMKVVFINAFKFKAEYILVIYVRRKHGRIPVPVHCISVDEIASVELSDPNELSMWDPYE